ncbi:LPXTG cell wall anchor domain-containing protein [Streptomyces sp. NPDC006349]|uniref:LPXTG cell wall anchor domain-containing protein n=1 Tax=Streptomyces sp. NPDC006349 TaxID=3156757 RepID=UPI000A6BF74B
MSRWIALPSEDEKSEQSASLTKLEAAAPGADPASPNPSESPRASSTSSPAPSATEPDISAAGSDAEAAEGDDSGSTGLIVAGIVVALLALGTGAWWLLKRRSASSPN